MDFFVALQFLTSLPSPFRRLFSTQELGRSQAYFPLVGLLIGALLALIDLLLRTILPLPLVSGLVLLSLILLTGGLHLDGFIDTCDGLFLVSTPAHRMEVMRDSRAGSYGVIGGIVLLLLKFLALGTLADPIRFPALVLAPVVSRWAMVLSLAAFPYAREVGKGTAFQGHGRWPLLAATACALAIAVLLWADRGAFLLVAAAIWTWLFGRYIARRLGGLTGDSYGAINETAELLVLLGASLTWRGFQ